MTDVPCRTTVHCANWGFCNRCDPRSAEAAQHVMMALDAAGIQYPQSSRAYSAIMAVLAGDTGEQTPALPEATSLREAYADAMEKVLNPGPRIGLMHHSADDLPLTATPEEGRRHKARQFANAAVEVHNQMLTGVHAKVSKYRKMMEIWQEHNRLSLSRVRMAEESIARVRTAVGSARQKGATGMQVHDAVLEALKPQSIEPGPLCADRPSCDGLCCEQTFDRSDLPWEMVTSAAGVLQEALLNSYGTDMGNDIAESIAASMLRAALAEPQKAPAADHGLPRCGAVVDCGHPLDEHSVYGCEDDCACEWIPQDQAIIHACPDEMGRTGCCGQELFELPDYHRLTSHPAQVTCQFKEQEER